MDHRTIARRSAAYDERPIPAPGEETVAFCQSEYKDLHDYMVEQGTLVKDYEDLYHQSMK